MALTSVKVSDLLERVFLLSVDADVVTEERRLAVPPCCTFMAEFLNPKSLIQTEELERMVFDRLMLTDLESRLVIRHAGKKLASSNESPEEHPVTYLWACYERVFNEERRVDELLRKTVTKARSVIAQNLVSILLTPEVTTGLFEVMRDMTPLHEKLFDLVDQCYDYKKGSFLHMLLVDMSKHIESKEDALRLLKPFFEKQCTYVSELGMEDVRLIKHIEVVTTIASVEKLSSAIMLYKHKTNRIMDTLATSSMKAIPAILLQKTCMYTGAASQQQHTFYEMAVMGGRAQAEDERAHHHIDTHNSAIFELFRTFLRKPEPKSLLLKWLGALVKEHAYAAKLWTHEQADHTMSVFPSDALFINLASVMVRLALPFCVRKDGVSNDKWLKIDPTYCAATGRENHLELGVHLQGLDNETCIISTSEDEHSIEISPSYNFITECFFLTHRSLYLGMHGLLVKFYRLNRDLNQMQSVYRDAMNGMSDPNTTEIIKKRFERAMTVYLSTKGSLSEPEFLSNFTLFLLTTARFLNQMAHTLDRSKAYDIPLPLVNSPPESLKNLPEFIVENLVDFLLFLKRFMPSELENFVRSSSTLLVLISIFMGNQSRMTNPHLRASLAEVLEAILPIKDDEMMMDTEEDDDFDNNVSINAIEGFTSVGDLTESVFQLFVDIEFTGDPHQFEQKFNYRRPLYSILKFLWGDQRGRDAVKRLSLASIRDIEAASPPLMLRFINLFLNDAVFLLDEAIDHLIKIKADEKDRDEGKWEGLPAKEKAEKEKGLKQMVNICRYHNVMSNKTVETLAYMSTEKEVPQLLCHAVLVDRIASMLNYFLERLVGPKMNELKVKDFTHCEFKPKELVHSICKIYANLGSNADFCRAVSQDGRSYSRQLFPRTIRVLQKIGSTNLVDHIQKVSDQAMKYVNEAENEEELFEDAPSEFFDPITSMLMHDPVVLPSSRVIVDRSTIARHLLSDNTDPFNRAPLTMEQVVSSTDLVKQMQDWLAEKKQQQQQQE